MPFSQEWRLFNKKIKIEIIAYGNAIDMKVMDDSEMRMTMKRYCSTLADYSVMVDSNGGPVIFAVGDAFLPKVDDPNDDVSCSTKELAVGLHVFINVTITHDKSGKSKTFDLLICPFKMQVDPKFRKAIETMLIHAAKNKESALTERKPNFLITSKTVGSILEDRNLTPDRRQEMLLKSLAPIGVGTVDLNLTALMDYQRKILPQGSLGTQRSAYCPNCIEAIV